MDLSAPFWMARLKLDRAEHLINELRLELEYYRANHRMQTRIAEKDGTRGVELVFDGGPVKAAPILGDLIHNLRSALDLTASELARLNNRNDKKVYFPISDSEESLDSRIKEKNFHLAGDDAVKLLKEFAPYRGGNAALRALHDMDIQDKHTALIPTAHSVRVLIAVRDDEGNLRTPETAADIDPSSIEFKFPADTAFAWDAVIPTTEKLVELVRGIVEAFAALVATRTPA